ncbi:MAG: hypothetical protein NZ550_03780 [Fimbriimonadales bacterium]|nr:hypothetical protein [Fimbriimonadales bacterium]MDW8052538.1 hypothetical protein [Armatimonadota bacterium]
MHAVLAVGWLGVALLAFWLAYWAGDSPTLLRVGMAFYALLLALTVVFVVLRKGRLTLGGKP